MQALATALGLELADPAFWMPLACAALLVLALLGAVVCDGIALGVACLSVFAPAPLRARMLALPAHGVNAQVFCLLLGLGVFMTAFPYAVRPVFGVLALPMALLALGTLLRYVAFEFRLRAPAALRARWQIGLMLGAWLLALSHGLLLAAFVVQFDAFSGSGGFTLFVTLGVVAAYCLLGATWLVWRGDEALRRSAARWARRAGRVAVAGAVFVCAALGLANPTVLARWGAGLPGPLVLALWLALLSGMVGLECLLRRSGGVHATAASAVLPVVFPFVLTQLMCATVLAGLGYSVFPYFILDDVTIWNSAAAVESMQALLLALAVALPLMAGFALWAYRDRRARP